MDDITAHKLLLLGSVVQAGSLTKAAEQEGLTVSAVSQQMRTLERAVGVPLLERHSRGIKPTEAGRIAGRCAADIRACLSGFEQEIGNIQRGESGRLICGVFPTLATAMGPSIINSSRRAPGMTINLRSARLSRLDPLLRSGDIDVALTWDYPWSEVKSDSLEQHPVMTDPTVMLVPIEQAHTQWSDHLFPGTRWVSRSGGHEIAGVLERVCGERGFSPEIVYEAHDWWEAQSMVAAGLGVAIAPGLASALLRDGVACLPFPAAPARTVYLSRRRNTPRHAGEDVLIQRLLDAEESLVSRS